MEDKEKAPWEPFEGRYCNVVNWSGEYKTHVYLRLNYSGSVDSKPLYFVNTHCSIATKPYSDVDIDALKKVPLPEIIDMRCRFIR